MFNSMLWDNFCQCQEVSSVKEDINPITSGVLADLMTKNTSAEVSFDCMYYSDGTRDEQGPFQTSSAIHVDAFPAQSVFNIYQQEIVDLHFGPTVRDNKLVATSRQNPGGRSPQVLLDFDKMPEFWGKTCHFPIGEHYPRAFSRADGRYIRVISYAEEELFADKIWKEMVIDAKFSVAVLSARHVRGETDDVWTMLRFEERDDQRTPETQSMEYRWSF